MTRGRAATRTRPTRRPPSNRPRPGLVKGVLTDTGSSPGGAMEIQAQG